MQNADRIWNLIDAKREDFLGLSDRIWEMPEIAYTEYRSVEEHRKMLETQGFAIAENPAGIPTAVIGGAGNGWPVIAILGALRQRHPTDSATPGHERRRVFGVSLILVKSQVRL
jgi:hypothetical protein